MKIKHYKYFKFIYIFLLSNSYNVVFSQQYVNDLFELNLKGEIKSIMDTCFYTENNLRKRIHIIEFNKIGQKETEVFYNENDTFENRNTYIYDDKNRLVKSIIYNSTIHEIQNIFTEDYDSIGNSIEKQFNGNFVLEAMTISNSIHDYKNKKQIQLHYSQDNSLDEIDTLIFNSKGFLVKEIFFDTKDSLSTNIFYLTDNKGNILEESCFLPDSNLIWKNNYSYDFNNNITQIYIYDADLQLVSESRYDYLYDKKGNWIDLLFYENEELISHTKRKINYK